MPHFPLYVGRSVLTRIFIGPVSRQSKAAGQKASGEHHRQFFHRNLPPLSEHLACQAASAAKSACFYDVSHSAAQKWWCYWTFSTTINRSLLPNSRAGIGGIDSHGRCRYSSSHES